ncbi:Hypothetical predicted protein [Marmota monax]|uniref:Uncharacterized protein n=1 Tax=Marmota monax TaxID=9995 RepID=A0A5E4BK89_MARMO|nr:Hypothetical predicted protein [Marmota monax]
MCSPTVADWGPRVTSQDGLACLHNSPSEKPTALQVFPRPWTQQMPLYSLLLVPSLPFQGHLDHLVLHPFPIGSTSGARPSFQLLPCAPVTCVGIAGKPWSRGLFPPEMPTLPLKRSGGPSKVICSERIHTRPQATRGLLPPPELKKAREAALSALGKNPHET